MSIQVNKLYICCTIAIVVLQLSACEVFVEEQYLSLRLPSIEQSYSWSGQSSRTLFYLHKDTIASKQVNLSSSELTISLDKSGVLPLFACVNIEGVQVGLLDCPLAVGGVYPFDAKEFSLVLAPLHKAQVAQLLLHLYKQGLQIQKLNVAKLYSAIESRSADAPFDFSRFYDYLGRDSLSSWGIAPQESYKILLPNILQRWVSTSYWAKGIEYTADDGTGQEVAVSLYAGQWLFLAENEEVNGGTDISIHASGNTTNNNALHTLFIFVAEDGSYYASY